MNTIIEMKDILEKTNSRISEAKEQISELEDGMIKKKKKNTATEQKREKRREMRTVLETSETILNTSAFRL